MTKEERVALKAAVDYYDAWRGLPSKAEEIANQGRLFVALDALHRTAHGGRWNEPAHAADCALMQPTKTEWTGNGYRLLDGGILRTKCTCGSDDDER